MVRSLMKEKIRSAEEELVEARRRHLKTFSYLRNRWGHHHEVMAGYHNILQPEVNQEWEDRKEKHKRKIDHLERRWVRRRREERRGEVGVGVADQLAGIRYRDTDLRRKAEEEGREVEVHQVPLIYGDIQATPEERAIMALPSKFSTFGAINKEEMEVEVMMAKAKWELQAREERKGDDGEGGEWTEEWEVEQQEQQEVYSTMDFANRRVTSMPTCRRTFPPRTLPARESAIFNSMKSRVLEVTEGYKRSRCDEKGNVRAINMTETEARGLRSIRQKVNDQEWVVMETDKSGRLTANTKENFLLRMEPHKRQDEVVDLQERSSMERVMNATTLQWGRILNLGERWNVNGRHRDRVQSALRTRSCMVPPLYGLPKDHKQTPAGEEELGPPLRPVVGATESVNGALSELMSELLTTVADRSDTDGFNCLSTEEMMAAYTSLNNSGEDLSNTVILSMDVVSMFPELDMEEVASVAAQEFLRSDLQVEVDSKELGLYLAILFQERREELEQRGLGEVVQRRRHPRARRIEITTSEVLARNEREQSKFLEPERTPTEVKRD